MRRVQAAASRQFPYAKSISTVIGPDGVTVCGYAGNPGGTAVPFLWQKGRFAPDGELSKLKAENQRHICGSNWVLPSGIPPVYD